MSVDDESFHPLGAEWENDLEEMLDDTEYDTDLGMEMAKDAMRVTKGELSEAEFHERYHEDVMEEFGQDDRPTEEAFEEFNSGGMSALEAFEGDGEMDRREVMKKMGAGAAFLGLGAMSVADDGEPNVEAAAAQEDEDDEGTQWGMVLDLERCDGCLSCVEACAEENQLDSGVNWMYVLDYEDPDQEMNQGRQRLIRPCQHCTDAPCEKVCPTTARHTRQSDGLVLTDYDVCIGCRYCQVACPYGVNYFQWDEPDVPAEAIDDDHVYDERGRPVDSRAPRGVMSKCTMCPSRQDGHMGPEMEATTACQEACPPEAIQFGDMNDPDSDPQQYLSNVVQSRARAMVEGSSPDRDDIQEAYDFLEGEIELQDVEYLEGDWNTDEVEAALYVQGEIDDDDLTLETDDDPEENELLQAIVDVLEVEFEEELDEEEIDEEYLETLALVLLDEEDEGEVDADDLGRANDAIDDVVTDAEASIQDLYDRYAGNQRTPAEIEEALALLEGEDEPWVTEDGITNEDVAAQVLEGYAGDETSTFKLLEDVGTNPNIVYVGNEPGPRAEQTEGPVSYSSMSYTTNEGEEKELTDARKDVTDEDTVNVENILGGM